MQKILIDENLSPSLAADAQRKGFLCSHVNHLGKTGTKDWELKRVILEGDWTFVTNNSTDFRGPANEPGSSGEYADVHRGDQRCVFAATVRRALPDMFDRRQVKVTSHMVGAAVDLHPALAREIVERGHEASGHGQTWTPQFSMTPEQERESYKQNIASIERATGTKPVGFNAFWLRGTPHTLEILQELGFIYHIDDISRDEPFLVNVTGKPFAVVPYTLHMNDIVNYESRYFSTEDFAGDLKREFDMLYAESAKRRRMMSVSAHDRVAGRPSRTRVLEEFIEYAQSHPGVAFMRKDEIARFALNSPLTIREGI